MVRLQHSPRLGGPFLGPTLANSSQLDNNFDVSVCVFLEGLSWNTIHCSKPKAKCSRRILPIDMPTYRLSSPQRFFFALTGGLGIYFMIFPADGVGQGLTILLGFGALLIGLFPVYHTTKNFLRQNRLAAPHIVVSQLPFTAGSTINGLLNQRVKPGAKVLSLIITLRCVKEIRDCESSVVKCLYEDPHELLPDQLVTTRNGINEYFSFDIPNRKNFPNSKRGSIHWSLTVTTSVAGWPDYKHGYTVKVFDVG